MYGTYEGGFGYLEQRFKGFIALYKDDSFTSEIVRVLNSPIDSSGSTGKAHVIRE
jgi:hypothetical protein